MSTQESEDDLKAEVTRLRARVAELERRVALKEPPAEETAAPRSDIPYETIVQALPIALVLYSERGDVVDVNDATCARYGGTRETLIGSFNILTDLLSNEMGYANAFRRALAGEIHIMPPVFYEHGPGPRFWSQSIYSSIEDATGARYVIELNHDVTAMKEAEAKEIRAREETLRSISTPLMPIADGVLVVPLVGEMTRERAEQLIETLLSGVASQRARITILDVTGMPQTGPDVIDALLRAARGVRLLGAEIILTGVRPSVAQALVELSVDLGSIVTQATLERGVAYALRARRSR